MPLQWPAHPGPVSGFRDREALVRHRLDSMTATSTFGDMVLALMSDPFWRPAESGPASGRSSSLFDAAVVLSKRLLHWAYDLNRGTLNRRRVCEALAFASDLQTLSRTAPDGALLVLPVDQQAAADRASVIYTCEAIDELWASYAASAEGSTASADFTDDAFVESLASLQRPECGVHTVTIWQVWRAFVASQVADELRRTERQLQETFLEAHALLYTAIEATDRSFFDSTEYLTDAFVMHLRSALCTTGAIQRLHIGLLKHGEYVPKTFLGFKRSAGPKFLRQATERREVTKFTKVKPYAADLWRNYLFDISVMWILVLRFQEAFAGHAQASTGAREALHALHKAHLWTLSGGLAASASNLAHLERGPAAREAVNDILSLSLTLHWQYLRLWDLGLQVFNAKAHPVRLVARRVAEGVFAKSSGYEPPDRPDVGTAVGVSPSWTYGLTTPEHLGLCVGPHAAVLGAEPTDVNYGVYTGWLSVVLTQTDRHLWSSASNPQAWNELHQGLPPDHAVRERLLSWSPPEPWSICDHFQACDDFKAKYWRNKEAEENAEVAAILQTVGA